MFMFLYSGSLLIFKYESMRGIQNLH